MGSAAKQIATFETRFKSKRKIAEGTFEFTFEKPADLHFQAGQHVRMSLINPPETDAEGDKRFFTIVSTPQDSDLVFVWRVRDTAFKRIMNNMQPGEKVIVQKRLGEAPKGSFVLHDDATKTAVFVAGGIGIVPAYAMIKDAIGRNLTHKMVLFYSNRRPEDAPYLSELHAIAKQNPNFTFIPTMTEPEKSVQKWQGEMGFINRTMIEKYIDSTEPTIYYISGLLDMVNAMRGVLDELGVSEDAVRAEEFDGFKMGEGAHGPASTLKKPNHLLIAIGVVIVLVMLAAHFGGGSLIDFKALSFTNPFTYLLTFVVLAVIVFKVLMMLKLKNVIHAKKDNEKVSIGDVIKSHNPKRKDQ
jgi:ferredoxin-NADP reductase